jgi:ribose transport system ATP-binding protein
VPYLPAGARPSARGQVWIGARRFDLGGGDQQKVQLGKWPAGRPKVLLVHEPTHAVDAGARHDIVRAIHQAAGEGCGVLVASRDPQELSLLCDRVLVFDQGRIVGELTGRPSSADIVEATFTRREQAGAVSAES